MIEFDWLYNQALSTTPVERSGGVQTFYYQADQLKVQLSENQDKSWTYLSLSITGQEFVINWSDYTLYRLCGEQLCLVSSLGKYIIFPNQAQALLLDKYRRIREQHIIPIQWQNMEDGLQTKVRTDTDECFHLNLVLCTEKSNVDSWFESKPIENICWAVEGSWTKTLAPNGFFDYLFFGQIYSKRFGNYGRFLSGQDAFSLFRIGSLLLQETEKSFYRFWLAFLAHSLHLSQNKEGVWLNGEWLQEPEVHTRFNIDGARLLNHAALLFDEPVWKEAALRNLRYFVKNADKLEEDKIWFLHDTCEFNLFDFKAKQKRALLHTAFGKSPHNALVLNTHLQTLVLIAEMQAEASTEELNNCERKGLAALELVLQSRPATFNYTIADWLLLRILSVEKASLPVRLLRRFGFKHLYKLFKLQKKPRFISPAGFLYRDAALPLFGYWYHFVNIYDLQQLAFHYHKDFIADAIDKGLSYSGNIPLAQFLIHHQHYLAPQWLQILKITKADTESYEKQLNAREYGIPPEAKSTGGQFSPTFWKMLKDHHIIK